MLLEATTTDVPGLMHCFAVDVFSVFGHLVLVPSGDVPVP